MNSPSDREWRLIRDGPRDGPTQMALEEIAAKTAVEDGVRTVRVYSWENTLSLGYGQEAESVDWDYCDREAIAVTRRQTGGGGIYHDRYGDISYTIVAPAEEVPGNLMECYALFCEPILAAFDRMGIDAAFAETPQPSIHQPACFLRDINPAHDIVAAGGKISGNAQYRTREAVIQHGSLRFSLEQEHHLGVFADHSVGERQFTERVTSIQAESGIDRETAVTALEDALGAWCNGYEGAWEERELEAARELAARKFASDEWVQSRKVQSA